MIKEAFTEGRSLRRLQLQADLIVAGGGMSGVCCAITAARAGIKVILVQDRPVLGGNASSEVRLWVLGATSHMGNNNRWSREGGVINELLVENLYRNREGNPVIFDTILLEKVRSESNITLLLNTVIHEVHKDAPDHIEKIEAFCSQNSTAYELAAPLFCDATGDGLVAFRAGASFRMGAESREEFGEGFAPDIDEYGELLGHSIYFYTKDTGRPVKFVPPAFAYTNAGELPRIRNYRLQDHGCRLWWVEYGGRLDTIHQSEEIKWELWKVVYGIWDYVKNSGKFPEAANLTLEWVGTIPGKRESRRFEGDYMLVQRDIVEQRPHPDAVAFGGWALDLHPADGVYSDKNSCTQWHSKGIYQIPYRCYYSKDIRNLFLAGRIISVSHVAFASSRVMATCSHGAQAVGMAAALAARLQLLPRDLLQPQHMALLQQELNKHGQSIPGVPLKDPADLLHSASLEASSELALDALPFDGGWTPLEFSSAQLLPLQQGARYQFRFQVKADRPATLEVQFRCSAKQHNYTPDVVLETRRFQLQEGEQYIDLPLEAALPADQYAFICFMKNEHVWVRASSRRVTGLLTVFNKVNKAVSNNGVQLPPEGIGVDSFEFWCPHRRPAGHNFGFTVTPSLQCFGADNVRNGWLRPTHTPNAWVAAPGDAQPVLHIRWPQPQQVKEIVCMFDTDYDHPMESSLMGHPEDVVPFCVRNFTIRTCNDTVIATVKDNYQTIRRIRLDAPVEAGGLKIQLERPETPAALFAVMVY